MSCDGMFKVVDDFPGYSVSSLGEVKNNITGRMLKQFDVGGYLCVNLYNNTHRRMMKVHRLVAETFLERLPDEGQVNHINCDKHDNRLDNLEWCTAMENVRHAHKNGLCLNHGGGTKKKPVLCVSTGIAYDSIADAARDNNTQYQAIRQAIARGGKCLGKEYRYIKEEK